jgi:integrase
MPRLTDTLVWTLPAPERGNKVYYDATNQKGRDWTPGFGLRVTAAGARSFVLNYRARGTERRMTIGALGTWSLSAARAEARRLRQLSDTGEDPLEELRADRKAPTVAELCERFAAEYLPSKRESTRISYEGVIRRYIKPVLGNKKADAVAYDDVAKLHRHVTTERGPYMGNRVLSILSKMFNLAIRWRWRADNPVRDVERNDEHKRERYLSPDEISRLLGALAAYKNQAAANVIRLLLLTGARKGEVLAMRWDGLDLKTGVWTKPASSVKQNRSHRVPLSEPAIQILRQLHENGPVSEWVFPGQSTGQHLSAVDSDWIAVCKSAKISGARLHDLRHTYASLLVSSGRSLPVIGALLGHTQPATTARYAHLFDDPLRQATESVGAIISVGGNAHGKR